MATANKMSEIASAMMKMSVECFFCGLSTITMITNRFKKKLSKTRQVERLGDILSQYTYLPIMRRYMPTPVLLVGVRSTLEFLKLFKTSIELKVCEAS